MTDFFVRTALPENSMFQKRQTRLLFSVDCRLK